MVIEAEVPLSGMFGYSTQVRSLSQGRASYSMEPLRFAPAPDSVLKTMLVNEVSVPSSLFEGLEPKRKELSIPVD